MKDATRALYALAVETAGLLDDEVTLAVLGGKPIVWGANSLLDRPGRVAMELFELLELGGTGLTIELINPQYRVGGAPYMSREVVIRPEPESELSAEAKSRIDELDAVEAQLNEKGWSMG